MDDALVVGRRERIGHRHGQFEDPADGQPVAADDGAERPAADVLHDEEAEAPGFFDGVQRHDTGMVQGGDGTGFLLEAGEAFRVAGEVGRQDLDGDVAAKAAVVGEVDLPHASRAELAADLVDAESRPGRERHGDTVSEKGSGGLPELRSFDYGLNSALRREAADNTVIVRRLEWGTSRPLDDEPVPEAALDEDGQEHAGAQAVVLGHVAVARATAATSAAKSEDAMMNGIRSSGPAAATLVQ